MSVEETTDVLVPLYLDESDIAVAENPQRFQFTTSRIHEVQYTLETLIKAMEDHIAHHINSKTVKNNYSDYADLLCPVLLGGAGRVLRFKSPDSIGDVGFTVPATRTTTREFINKIKAQYTWDTKDSLVWITLADSVKIALTDLLMESLYSSIHETTNVSVTLNIEGTENVS